MIGNTNDKELIILHEKLKDTTDSLWRIYLFPLLHISFHPYLVLQEMLFYSPSHIFITFGVFPSCSLCDFACVYVCVCKLLCVLSYATSVPIPLGSKENSWTADISLCLHNCGGRPMIGNTHHMELSILHEMILKDTTHSLWVTDFFRCFILHFILH